MTKADKQLLKDFGKRLKLIRRAKQFTQEKLAFTIDVEISQISRLDQ